MHVGSSITPRPRLLVLFALVAAFRAAQAGPPEGGEGASAAPGRSPSVRLLDERAGVRFRIDGDGLSASAWSGAWAWGLALESWGWAGSERSVERSGAQPRPIVRGSGVSWEREAGLVEWYRRVDAGLEHGFTVERPPPGEGAVLRFLLLVRSDLRGFADPRGDSAVFLGPRGSEVVAYRGLAVFDAQGRRLPARLDVRGEVLSIEVDVREATFPVLVDPTVTTTYVKPHNPDAADAFGYAVALDGDTMVVGAPFEASAATGVGGNGNDDSAPFAGAAYVFVRDSATGAWSQQAYLKASNPGVDDHFGVAVSISGDRLVVGASGEDSAATGVGVLQADDSTPQAGAAYVFARDPATGSWMQEAYLKATNTDAGDLFGDAVAIAGDTVVVGAWREDSSGVGVNGLQSDNSSTDAGAAYEYRRDPTTGLWVPQSYFKASNTDPEDGFGRASALDGDRLVCGAPFEDGAGVALGASPFDDSAPNAGAAYVFDRDASTGSWSAPLYVKATNTDPNDRFGGAVALSGRRFAAGAIGEASGSPGVGGDESDDSAFDAGAVYVYGSPPPVVPFGVGCHGLAIGWQNEPKIGSSNFTLTLVGAPASKPADLFVGGSDTQWAGIALPLFLGPFGAPGCLLFTGLQVVFPTAADPSGQSSVAVSIPNDPAIVDCTVYFQWRARDPGLNPLGMAFSDALAVAFVP